MNNKPIARFNGIYTKLEEDIIRLHANWQLYKQLFTKSNKQRTLLNETAPGFFMLIGNVLIDDAIISLSRLTDSAHYDSLAGLVKELKLYVRNDFYEELEKDLDKISLLVEDIRKYRHIRIAHRAALKHTPEIQYKSSKYPIVTKNKIQRSISAISRFMNKVHGYFENVDQRYDPIIRGDAKDLIFFLKKGVEVTKKE